jgi:hypothetical protein
MALHLWAFLYVASATARFEFEFELTLPTEVEFGLTGEMTMIGGPAEPTPPPSAPSAATAAPRPKNDAPDPVLDAGVPDPDPDPDPAADPAADPDPETGPETDPAALPVASPTLTGPSRIPPGAQLALRIDMKRIRESPLGPDVTSFLHGVPDWRLLLDGSGIDPVSDLDRLLIATPNLERSKLVLAGRHRRDANFARESVRRLARSRDKRIRWERRFGVPTTQWHNRDETRRTIALLSPRHFSITRREDLVRLLAIAKARELRDAEEEGLVAASGPDALLSMGPDEAISLEVEGVHRFVLGSTKHIPLRLRVAVRETGSNEATVTALATYASSEDATSAAQYWKNVATFYSQQLFMTLAGFGKTIRKMELTPKEERVEVSFKLNADQIRFLLSYAEGRLQGGAMRERARDPQDRPPPTKKGP